MQILEKKMKVGHTHVFCLFHALFLTCVKLLAMVDFSSNEITDRNQKL